MTTRTRATGTHSSSATSCVCAVSIPWPSSHLPVNALTVPSAPTAIHESSRPGSTCEARVSNGPCASAAAGSAATLLNATISTPACSRNSRRERVDISRLLRVAVNRREHPRVREAAAEDTRERLANFSVRSFRMFVEESRRGEDDAAQAEAALRRLQVDERTLKRVRGLWRSQSFERDHFGRADAVHGSDARPHCAATHEDGAGAALAEAASELRPAKPELVAEHIQQRRGRVDIDGLRFSIDQQPDDAHWPDLTPGGITGTGTTDKGQRTTDTGQGTGDRGQGTGDRGQGTGD